MRYLLSLAFRPVAQAGEREVADRQMLVVQMFAPEFHKCITTRSQTSMLLDLQRRNHLAEGLVALDRTTSSSKLAGEEDSGKIWDLPAASVGWMLTCCLKVTLQFDPSRPDLCYLATLMLAMHLDGKIIPTYPITLSID